MIEIAGQRYPFDQMAIVGARVDDARHPAGAQTVEQPCSHCGAAMLIEAKNRDLSERTGRPVICLPCARDHYPDMLCGTHAGDGHAVTIREAIENGWLQL
jgi:hypothetical protein